jgi:hypothetical protein
MGEVILNTVPKTKKVGGGRTSAVQEFWLQNYLLLFFRKTPSRGGGAGASSTQKVGAMLAYLFTLCAFGSGCHFVFSYGMDA